MGKSTKILIFIVVGLLGITLLIEYVTPKKIDWTEHYKISSKSPYGLYILDNEIQYLFKESFIEKLNVSPYEYFIEYLEYGNSTFDGDLYSSFLYIGNTFELDINSFEKMTKFVAEGNQVFISTYLFPQVFEDSLKIKTKEIFALEADSIAINTPTFSQETTSSRHKDFVKIYFEDLDSLNPSTVLGNIVYTEQETAQFKPNYIAKKYGKGTIFLHLQPIAFTNLHLLHKEDYKYIEKVFQPLYNTNIVWHNKFFQDKKISSSPLRFIKSQPALHWAWILMISGIIVFILFNVKRKQRIVPVKKPIVNTTVEFTKTIGNLYYSEGNHKDIINKIILYTLEKIRSEYYLNTMNLDESFIEKLHLKSGKDIKVINKMIYFMNKYRELDRNCNEEDIKILNTSIENFFNKK